MKKVIKIISLIGLSTFAGCSYIKPSSMQIEIVEDVYYREEASDSRIKDIKLSEEVKREVLRLKELWNQFQKEPELMIDPIETFKQSEYLEELSDFFEKRESLEITIADLGWILEQYGLEAFEKTIDIDEKQFNLRVINYAVDLPVTVKTGGVDLHNKWIFVQCWNEEEFYFSTISQGDIHVVYDFIPIVREDKLHIILIGQSSPSYPRIPFLWAWSLEKDGFRPSHLFDLEVIEEEAYRITHDIDMYNRESSEKWEIHTNGAFLYIEKESSPYKNEFLPWDYLNIIYEAYEKDRMGAFIISDQEGEELSIILQENQVILRQE